MPRWRIDFWYQVNKGDEKQHLNYVADFDYPNGDELGEGFCDFIGLVFLKHIFKKHDEIWNYDWKVQKVNQI